jgi:hypothetical protein
MTSNRSVSEMVERIMREIDAQANTRPTGEGLVYSYGEVERGIIEALGNQAPSDADVERVAPFEELCIEAYKHGWLEGCTTLLKLPRGQRNELPHMDAMNEGCGTFMGEIWPRLAAAIPSAVASDDVVEKVARGIYAVSFYGTTFDKDVPYQEQFRKMARAAHAAIPSAVPSDDVVERLLTIANYKDVPLGDGNRRFLRDLAEHFAENANCSPAIPSAVASDAVVERITQSVLQTTWGYPGPSDPVVKSVREGVRAAIAAIPSAVASDDVRDALVKAYTAGATEVHACWMAGKAIECMSPDFTEAAHDYASEAVAAIPSDGGVEPQDLGASSGFDPARMTMFLEILSAAGGEADASESSWNWINAFLEEHEKRYPDTFNEAIDAGYVDWSHDSDSDNSTIRLTATGRAALKASGEE